MTLTDLATAVDRCISAGLALEDAQRRLREWRNAERIYRLPSGIAAERTPEPRPCAPLARGSGPPRSGA